MSSAKGPRERLAGGTLVRMNANAELHALLSRQDGLITLAQAVDRGMSVSTVQRRVRAGAWDRVLPRVFLVGGHPLTGRARVRATGLWAGDRAAISGPAAALWHRMLTTAPDVVDVTVPRRLGLRRHPGLRIRRRDLHPFDQVGIEQLWLTAKPLTALETAVTVPDGSSFLDRALQKHVSFDPVYRAYCRNLGANGFAQVAVLLTAAADRADSAAERLMITIMRQAGLTGWVRGHGFGRWTIDFAFPERMLAIEVDGWAWHMDVDRFRADRHKGNALVRARWDLLRFTWHDLTNRPDYVIGEIRASLAEVSRAS